MRLTSGELSSITLLDDLEFDYDEIGGFVIRTLNVNVLERFLDIFPDIEFLSLKD